MDEVENGRGPDRPDIAARGAHDDAGDPPVDHHHVGDPDVLYIDLFDLHVDEPELAEGVELGDDPVVRFRAQALESSMADPDVPLAGQRRRQGGGTNVGPERRVVDREDGKARVSVEECHLGRRPRDRSGLLDFDVLPVAKPPSAYHDALALDRDPHERVLPALSRPPRRTPVGVHPVDVDEKDGGHRICIRCGRRRRPGDGGGGGGFPGRAPG